MLCVSMLHPDRNQNSYSTFLQEPGTASVASMNLVYCENFSQPFGHLQTAPNFQQNSLVFSSPSPKL